jgi:hypothetical protein
VRQEPGRDNKIRLTAIVANGPNVDDLVLGGNNGAPLANRSISAKTSTISTSLNLPSKFQLVDALGGS